MSSQSPFDELRRVLANTGEESSSQLNLDYGRKSRCGLPEIVYCSGKSSALIASALGSLCESSGRAVGTRLDPTQREDVTTLLAESVQEIEHYPDYHCIVAHNNTKFPRTGGRVVILTAGSSDIPVAGEASLIVSEAGCDVQLFGDIGVAGIHRVVRPIEMVSEWDADVIIVAAGMDGVLPTVVAGLVDIPVIGLPTSTGYGFGGEGLGALTTMLQACAPGVSVVNIDNGVGAGTMAALIANRAAQFR